MKNRVNVVDQMMWEEIIDERKDLSEK